MIEGLLIGLFLGVIGMLIASWFWRRSRSAHAPAPDISVHSSIETLKAVGELVVLKVFTQQIVTKSDHLFGAAGEKWLGWMLSSKKTAMIFDFVVDFRYDLKSTQFSARAVKGEKLEITMPPCFYEIQLKDIKIYDEKASAFAPIMLPQWVGQMLGGRFTEKEKNELIAAARQEAESLAGKLARRMMSEVQHSAESTLGSIAKGMGFARTQFHFRDGAPVQSAIDISAMEASARDVLVLTDDAGKPTA